MEPEKETGSTPVGKILIADDDENFRGLLARRADRMGLDVHLATNGAEAIEAVTNDQFDALVVDLVMPEHTGLEVIEAAKNNDTDVVAVILTGSASIESAVEAIRQGVFDYLTKPLESMAAFEMALTRALEHRFLIRENKRLFQEVQRLAVTDPLTELNNRRRLEEVLSLEVERAHRYRRPLSIVMIDMDGLKKINDTHGHPAGDAALILVADSIRTCVRKVDTATRYGGDEFVIVLPEADMKEAEMVVRRILKTIKSNDGRGDLSVSVGIIQWAPEHQTIELFIEAVDHAMYDAKRKAGKSRPRN